MAAIPARAADPLPAAADPTTHQPVAPAPQRQPAADASRKPVATPQPPAAPGSAATPAPSATSYANCAAVRAAGAAPIRQGDPGYSAKLDGDGDGVGCER